MKTPCVRCTGALTANGYGLLRVNGVRKYAHRVAWERTHGAIPDGLVVDHLCRNKTCINVNHLTLTTRGENVRRGCCAKLTWDDVCIIRRELSIGTSTLSALAQRFGVSRTTIWGVREGRYWKEALRPT